MVLEIKNSTKKEPLNHPTSRNTKIIWSNYCIAMSKEGKSRLVKYDNLARNHELHQNSIKLSVLMTFSHAIVLLLMLLRWSSFQQGFFQAF